ncbi:hypothetical protein A0H81_04598 [Grifola frondosa]|uniref:Uncharacterized protein n=1 Tax=Grifola frondosa TaxID=5627 RepID=A0A1C7MF04_GRIFR|nr:hypothetical protein A0H81_04598 [Grifola frondosa]
MSSCLPDGHEHSMKIVESACGILLAAARQTWTFMGLAATLSGSTSPKKRNSRAEGSWRIKNAAHSYVPVVAF